MVIAAAAAAAVAVADADSHHRNLRQMLQHHSSKNQFASTASHFVTYLVDV